MQSMSAEVKVEVRVSDTWSECQECSEVQDHE
jgi:hypothetical protein